MLLVFALAFTVSASDFLTPLEPRAIEHFITWVAPPDPDLANRLRKSLALRAIHEPPRSTNRYPWPFEERIERRVHILADQFATVLLDRAGAGKAERAVAILGDLAAALARNRGTSTSLYVPVMGCGLGLAALGASLIELDIAAPVGAVFNIGSLGLAVYGLLHASTHVKDGTPEQRANVTARMLEEFWIRVDESWRGRSTKRRGRWPEVACDANRVLALDRDTFRVACERWLDNLTAPRAKSKVLTLRQQ